MSMNEPQGFQQSQHQHRQPGMFDFKKNGGLGNLLNFGLLGLMNGQSPLLNPGMALQGLMGGGFGQQQYPHHQRGYGAPPWQRPQAPAVQQVGTPPIVPPQPQQPGMY